MILALYESVKAKMLLQNKNGFYLWFLSTMLLVDQTMQYRMRE
jgi:hypothetical protein